MTTQRTPNLATVVTAIALAGVVSISVSYVVARNLLQNDGRISIFEPECHENTDISRSRVNPWGVDRKAAP